jgi:hypothetical protein
MIDLVIKIKGQIHVCGHVRLNNALHQLRIQAFIKNRLIEI